MVSLAHQQFREREREGGKKYSWWNRCTPFCTNQAIKIKTAE